VSPNIRHDETCRLAGAPVRLTGETKTIALHERLERERSPTATAGSDYTAVSAQTLSVPAGDGIRHNFNGEES